MRFIPAAVAMVGGYLLAAFAAGGPGALLSPSPNLGAGLVALLCAIVVYLGSEARGFKRQTLDLSSALAAERDRVARAEGLASTLGPVLEIISLEAALRWTADAAHAVAGGSYAHVAALNGNHHHTVLEGDPDACPSWWNPSIQRLLLWSCRGGDVARSEEAVHGITGFMAVPVGPAAGEKWGAIIVGGKEFGTDEERALRGLAERVAPGLGRSGDALGGLDEPSGLPNRASLERALRQDPSRRAALTVLAIDVEGARGSKLARGVAADDALIRRIGERLGGGGQRAFRYEGSKIVVLVDGSREDRARNLALAIRRLAQEKTGGPGRPPLAIVVGFAFAEAGDEDPDAVLDAALWALEDAKGATEGVAGLSAAARVGKDPLGEAPITNVIQALLGALEARDPSIGEHILGVFGLAGRIGRELSLPPEQMDALTTGALLHDIGKIGIPDRVLHKPGPLTEEEYEVIKRHPVLGAEFIAPLSELAPALPAIKHHHERFDGGGYPDGLRGEDVPLIARVVSVADAFDSMIRDRPHAQGVRREVALEEIRANSGTQFDPRIVRALSRVAAEPQDGRTDLFGQG